MIEIQFTKNSLLGLGLSFVLGFMCVTPITTVKAVEDDIMQYVVSGSGTFEEPYIFGENNEYKEMLDSKVRAQLTSVSTRSQFSASLTGGSYYAPNGGKWSYTHGSPNSISDYMLWYISIIYTSDTNTISSLSDAIESNENVEKIIMGLANHLAGEALENYLIAHGVPKAAAEACSEIFGEVFSSFSFTKADRAAIDAALNCGGLLTVSYRHSYHGSWFQSDVLASWDEVPYANIP